MKYAGANYRMTIIEVFITFLNMQGEPSRDWCARRFGVWMPSCGLSCQHF